MPLHAAAVRGAPTAVEVVAGTGPGGAGQVSAGTATVTSLTARTPITVHITTGLIPTVTYIVYFTAKDLSGRGFLH